jgi:SAM-dependent methyltransferase
LHWVEPEIVIRERENLPFLVEHWYLGTRTTRYMMVRRFREVLVQADPEPGHRLLDLGCGWAYGTLWARLRGCRVAGIDLAIDQLQWARAHLEAGDRLNLAQANAARLPFRDSTFDRAVSVEMFEHVFRPDRPRVFSEIARVLKPSGRFALSTPNSISPIELAKRALIHLPALRRRLPSMCYPEAADRAETYHPYRYHHPIDLGELAALARGAGLEVQGARRFLWVMKTLPDPLLGVGRVLESAAEHLPVARRFGATTLLWGRKP